jgi:ABC-2 type transport system ATP-binding protein
MQDRVRVYSHGMRRRLALAQAILPRPDVLLIDEWEAGLDPEGARGMRDLILRLNREHGLTIALSSHRPNGVETMGERVVILRQGRVVFGGRWHELDDGGAVVRLAVDEWARALPIVRALGGTSVAEGTVALPSLHAVPDLVAALVAAGVRVHAVEPIHASAEERYLRVVGAPPA